LDGSATNALINELQKIGYWNEYIQVYETLRECVYTASQSSTSRNKIILFSPGSASFEKFKNEFDRGEQFNRLAQKYFC
jgi:UDP-N-acetylmuramoylalanine--D-glutamate ligase